MLNLAESAFSGIKELRRLPRLRADEASLFWSPFSSEILGTSMSKSLIIWSAILRLSEERRGARGLIYLKCKLAVYEDNGIPHIRFLFEHDERIDLRLHRIHELCDIAVSKPGLRLLYVMPSNIRRRVADVKARRDLLLSINITTAKYLRLSGDIILDQFANFMPYSSYVLKNLIRQEQVNMENLTILGRPPL